MKGLIIKDFYSIKKVMSIQQSKCHSSKITVSKIYKLYY